MGTFFHQNKNVQTDRFLVIRNRARNPYKRKIYFRQTLNKRCQQQINSLLSHFKKGTFPEEVHL